MSIINEQEEKYKQQEEKYRQQEEKKRERDKVSNGKKYYLDELKKMGLSLSKIHEKIQEEIVDFLRRIKEENEEKEKKENDERKRGNNLLKEYNKEKYHNEAFAEIFESILNKIDKVELQSYIEVEEIIQANAENIMSYARKIDLNRILPSCPWEVNAGLDLVNKHCDINYEYLEYMKKIQKKCLEKDKRNFRYILLNENFFLWTNNGIIYDIENIYFARINSKEKREQYFNIVKKNLEELLKEFSNEEKKTEKRLKIDYKVILFTFFSLKKIADKLKKELSMEKEILKIEYIETDKSEDKLMGEISTNYEKITPKNLNLKKRDNILEKKEENIDKIIDVLNKTINGAILFGTKEDKKMLYKLIYQSDIIYKKQQLSTIVKKILGNKDEDDSIHHNIYIDEELKDSEYDEFIDFINKLIKKEKYFNYGKKDEYECIIEIKTLLEKINVLILREICPRKGNKKLLRIIERLQKINREIKRLNA